jgi:hypothetical protein
MKGKPNVDAFLNGAASVESKPTEVKEGAAIKTLRRGKMLQLPVDLLVDLKRYAIDQGAKRGSHVTETELIEAAIRKYIYL